jgi:hypothetical protein
VFDEEDLASLSSRQRRDLISALVRLEDRDTADRSGGGRRRVIALAAIVACCIGLAIWIGVLAVTLPRYYRSGGWRGAWVGFDLAELVAFAATGWAAWRRRQVLIICLLVLATLLCCDAWFDVVLDARTKGFAVSLLSALLIELPLAALAIARARQLLRLSIGRIMLLEGRAGPVPPLRKVPMTGMSSGSHLADLFTEPLGDMPVPLQASDERSPTPEERSAASH